MPEQSTVRLTETAGTITPDAGGSGRYQVLCISEGKGSSGFYPRATLQEAAQNKLITSGTFAYLDHPSATEAMDRPERSVRDLAGVFTSDAEWSDEHNGLVAAMQVFGPYRQLIGEMAEHIGLSIRGDGEIEVREGQRTVTSLAHIESVDFVTRPGRGGKVLSLLESARASHRAVERGIAEATANDLREWLGNALTDAYGGEKSWVWVRDFDDSTVWYEHEAPNGQALYQQSYSEADGAVTLSGSPVEVRVETRYVPVDPAGGSPTPTPTEESLMPQIEEARLGQLEEAAGRVPVLEAERDAAIARATAAETALTRHQLVAEARPLIAAHLAEATAPLPAAAQARVVEAVVVAGIPAGENGIDTEALTAAVEAVATREAAYLAAIAPAAPVAEAWGSFVPAARTEVAESDALTAYDTAAASIFGRKGA